MANHHISANNLPEFDPAEQLRTEEDIAAYLAIVREENDPAALEQAHATVARARQTHADIERVARAVEADAGQPLPNLRGSLMQMRRGEFAAVHTPEMIAARRARRDQDGAGESLDVAPRD